MTDSPNDKKFMRETVVKPKEKKGRLIRKIVGLLLFAVLFGVISAVSFVLSLPIARKYLDTETKTSITPITIEMDEEPGAATELEIIETMESTIPEAESETETEISSEDLIRQIVKEEMEQDVWNRDTIKAFNQVLTNIGESANKSIVTISAVKHQKDWLDNSVTSTGQYSGLILAVNSGEIVILTGSEAIEDADALEIMFGDGSSAAAWVKQNDSAADMATISVNPAELSEETVAWINPIELGNSYSVKTGDMIVAVGSPAGWVHSLKHGTVTYVARGVPTTDGQTRILHTDIDCCEEKGTFFLNLSGQLIGWATTIFDEDDMENTTHIMSISDYKGYLQKLSNGIKIPYLGIKGQEVNSSMQEEGIPKGIYIMESIAEGPAYLAGIQNGDILTKVEDGEVLTVRDLQSRLEDIESGTEVVLTIQRKGIDTYKEIKYYVTIGAR